VENAVEFIAVLRQAQDLSALPVGRRVVVIGGGMTAIDAAIQSKLLGAEDVTICYRRGKDRMNASEYEQDLAAANGVTIRHWLQPKRVVAEGGRVKGIELEYTAETNGKLAGTGETLTLACDQVFKAIGQTLDAGALNGSGNAAPELVNGRIMVDEQGRTSLAKVWAGGDCILGGDDLTVSAVAQGRDAAESIHRALTSNGRA
jgi:glutamate synthase (NADPH/NADH) small chain